MSFVCGMVFIFCYLKILFALLSITHSLFQGRKVLREALTAGEDFVAEMHEAMQQQIPDLTT